MENAEYDLMYRVEGQLWWYGGMASISRSILMNWYSPAQKIKILDAGCGTGASMAGFLSGFGQVTGIDVSPVAIHYCRLRDLHALACSSVCRLPFPDACFDLVTSFDVVSDQGVLDDLAALREIQRVLAPGGRILLRLPAYAWLRSRHDAAVATTRRYSRPQVKQLLEQCGLVVDHITYANSLLFPLALIKRMIEKVFPARSARSELAINFGPANRFFKWVLTQEAGWAARAGFPFGLSVVAVGRKGG